MVEDIKPLVEKLQSKEPLSFADFQGVLDAYKAGMADGRISFLEGLRILRAVMALFSSFTEGLPAASQPGFGFTK